jgi:hypothetical protein
MYLVFGLITMVLGILIVFFLPDSPMDSRLSHEEKVAAIERLRENQTGIENKTFKKSQMIESLVDPKTWLIVLIVIAANIPTGLTGSFSATIILGYVSMSQISTL